MNYRSYSEVFSDTGAGGIGINGTVHINIYGLQISNETCPTVMKNCLLGISPASENYKPTFRNSVSVPSSAGGEV